MNQYELESNNFIQKFKPPKLKKSMLQRKIDEHNKKMDKLADDQHSKPKKKSKLDIHTQEFEKFCEENNLEIGKDGKIRDVQPQKEMSDESSSETEEEQQARLKKEENKRWLLNKDYIRQIFKRKQLHFIETTRIHFKNRQHKSYHVMIDKQADWFVNQENKEVFQAKQQVNWDDNVKKVEIQQNDPVFNFYFLVTFLTDQNTLFNNIPQTYKERQGQHANKKVSKDSKVKLIQLLNNYKTMGLRDNERSILKKLLEDNIKILEYADISKEIQNAFYKFKESDPIASEFSEEMYLRLKNQNSQSQNNLYMPEDLKTLNLLIVKDLVESKLVINQQEQIDFQFKKRQDIMKQALFIFSFSCEFMELHLLHQKEVEFENRTQDTLAQLVIVNLCKRFDLHYLCRCYSQETDYCCPTHEEDWLKFKQIKDAKMIMHKFELYFIKQLKHDSDKYVNQMLIILEVQYKTQFKLNHREQMKLLGTDQRKIVQVDSFSDPQLGIKGMRKKAIVGYNFAGLLIVSIRNNLDQREEMLSNALVQFEEENKDYIDKKLSWQDLKCLEPLNPNKILQPIKHKQNNKNTTLKGYTMGLQLYFNIGTLNVRNREKFYDEHTQRVLHQKQKAREAENRVKNSLMNNITKLLGNKGSFSPIKINKFQNMTDPRFNIDAFRQNLTKTEEKDRLLDTTKKFFEDRKKSIFLNKDLVQNDLQTEMLSYQKMLKDCMSAEIIPGDDLESPRETDASKQFKRKLERAGIIWDITDKNEMDELRINMEVEVQGLLSQQWQNKIRSLECKHNYQPIVKVKMRAGEVYKAKIKFVSDEMVLQIEILEVEKSSKVSKKVVKDSENWTYFPKRHIDIKIKDLADVEILSTGGNN